MKLKLLLLFTSTTLLIATATATVRFMRESINGDDVFHFAAAPAIESIRTAQASDEAPSDIRVVLLTLRSEGFEPAELQIPSGEYLMIVRNRTGLEEVDVRLVRDSGQHLGQARVGARLKDWKQRIKLTPGTYVLSETQHPDWTSRVVVDK